MQVAREAVELGNDQHGVPQPAVIHGPGQFWPVVILARFHLAIFGAEPKQNAGVQVPIDGSNPTSPVNGGVTLTSDQQEQLMAGRWYVNVHTQDPPNGAIRGQMAKFHP